MKINDSVGVKIFRIVNTVVLCLLVFATFYPVYHVFMASFSDGSELLAHRGILYKPLKFTTIAYETILEKPYLFKAYLNTIFICVVSLVFNVILTSFAAYFLSRKQAVGKRTIMMMILFTMYFNGGLIPTYMVIRNLGLLDTLWSVILPAAISTYNLIVLRTAFASIPDSLYEAAWIDGAGHFVILFRIVIPLSKATIAVIILYYLVYHWNSWFNASIYIDNRDLYPLQLYLREILIENDQGEMGQNIVDSDRQTLSETLKYAIITVATVPMLCVYPFLQKYFAKGVMIGAVKG